MTTTSRTYRYPRRPERPRPDLDSPAWQERLASVADQIRAIVDGERQELHVGAIWGARGTGKTSFLETLYRRLSSDKTLKAKLNFATKDPQSKGEDSQSKGEDSQSKDESSSGTRENKRPPLFAPDLIDDSNGDHLFAHLLHFLQENYSPKVKLGEPLRLLTEHQYSDVFKDFESETATSKKDLKDELLKRLTTRATFSSKLRESIRESIHAMSPRTDGDAKRWVLLLVDDIDLVPHRGPELLTLLHLYLRDLPFIVLLAADREQLVEHTTVYLRSRHGRRDRALALQYVAKQVPYEWTVPLPSPQERLDDLLDKGRQVHPEGAHFGHKLEEDFKLETADLLGTTWKRLTQEPGSDNRKTWMRAFAEYMLAPRWRALNRTYNRLATLREDQATITTWQGRIGVPATLVHPVLTAIIAIDEKHPQLALWDAFASDTEEVISNLLPLAPPSDNQDDTFEVHPDPVPTIDESNVGAPLDRLRWYTGRELVASRRSLAVLAEFLDAAREASSDKHHVILALTASRLTDPRKELEELKEQLIDSGYGSATDVAKLPLIDLSEYASRGRPSPSEIASMLPELRDSNQLADRDIDALYPRAPLSLAAWLGWHTRQRPRSLAVIGLFRQATTGESPTKPQPSKQILTTFRVDPAVIDRWRRKAKVLVGPIDLTLESPPEVALVRTEEALVVVDVGIEPDTSSRAPKLWNSEEPVFPGHLYKLVSHRGFILTNENLADVLADVIWLLQELRGDGIQRLHLALATPIALAFFIGREVHPFVPVDLYERGPETDSYHYVTTLK